MRNGKNNNGNNGNNGNKKCLLYPFDAPNVDCLYRLKKNNKCTSKDDYLICKIWIEEHENNK
jgi:hypothetical protein